MLNLMDKLTRFQACMVLSAVGDAMGYKNGLWEFNKNGKVIHKQAEKLGGVENLHLDSQNWIVSDDTVMHIATAEAILEQKNIHVTTELYLMIAKYYKSCIDDDMQNRSPGLTCIASATYLDPLKSDGYIIPFNERGAGCGAAMRSMCLGLIYSRPEQLDDLIAVSIESGRMTHNHPIGYLGSLVSALFTSYALNDIPLKEWGCRLLNVLSKAKDYIVEQKRDVRENIVKWDQFVEFWKEFLKLRNIFNGESEPIFPKHYGVCERDEFYNSISLSGWGGSCGHDSPIIAYDALLASKNDWKELCLRGILHGGDNDSTGAIAGAWFGALYGFDDVPVCHYKDLEYLDKLKKIGNDLFNLNKIYQSNNFE